MRPYQKPVKSASEQLSDLFSKPSAFLIEAYPYQALMRLPFSQRIEVMRRQLTAQRPSARKNPAKAADAGGYQSQVKARINAAAGDRILNELNPLNLGVELLEEALEEVVESGAIDAAQADDFELSSSDLLAAMAVSEIGAAGEIMAHVLDDAIYSGEAHFNSW